MALVDCSECGKQVSTLAATCPHCGAPQRALTPASPPDAMSRPISGKQAVGIVLTLIIGVVLAIAVSSGSQSPPTDHTTSPTVSAPVEAPPIAVTTTELEAAYGLNTVAADDRFKGKRLLVRGVVQDINTDISNDVYIVFATSEMSFSRP